MNCRNNESNQCNRFCGSNPINADGVPVPPVRIDSSCRILLDYILQLSYQILQDDIGRYRPHKPLRMAYNSKDTRFCTLCPLFRRRLQNRLRWACSDQLDIGYRGTRSLLWCIRDYPFRFSSRNPQLPVLYEHRNKIVLYESQLDYRYVEQPEQALRSQVSCHIVIFLQARLIRHDLEGQTRLLVLLLKHHVKHGQVRQRPTLRPALSKRRMERAARHPKRGFVD